MFKLRKNSISRNFLVNLAEYFLNFSSAGIGSVQQEKSLAQFNRIRVWSSSAGEELGSVQ
jgi:hypothetical protein